MIKNVYRKEGTNEFFVREVERNDMDFVMENCYICTISRFVAVSRKDNAYMFLGDSSVEISYSEIKLNNELVRIYDVEGTEIAEFYTDKLCLNFGGDIRIVRKNYSVIFSMEDDYIIAI